MVPDSVTNAYVVMTFGWCPVSRKMPWASRVARRRRASTGFSSRSGSLFILLCFTVDDKRSMLPILCINMKNATQRWQSIQRHVSDSFRPGSVGLHRMEAVNGKDLDIRDPRLPVSPKCRERLYDRLALCHWRQLDSQGALGCYLSHCRCWQWLLDHPEHEHVLILEDDACFAPSFRTQWTTYIVPFLQTTAYHFLLLGYRPLPGYYVHAAPCTFNLPLYDKLSFLGSHCYLVSRSGAQRLLQLAFPIQVHIDSFLEFLFAPLRTANGEACYR